MTFSDSPTIASLLSGTDIPSRTVLKSKYSLALQRSLESYTIIHFDDIRDAIDVVLRSVRDNASDNKSRLSTAVAEPDYHKSSPPPLILDLDRSYLVGSLKMNQLFDVRDVMFTCTSSVEQHLKETGTSPDILPSACVMVTIAFDTQEMVEFVIVDPLVTEIERNFTNYGPILAKSEVKRNVRTGSIFKFFVEFYRVQDCISFLADTPNISVSVGQ